MDYVDEVEDLIQKEAIWGKIIIKNPTLCLLYCGDNEEPLGITEGMITRVQEALKGKNPIELERFLKVSRVLKENFTYDDYFNTMTISLFLGMILAIASIVPIETLTTSLFVVTSLIILFSAYTVGRGVKMFRRVYRDYIMALECIIIAIDDLNKHHEN